MFYSPEQISIPVEWVSRNIIRQIFNENQYWERAKAGEFRLEIRRDRHHAHLPEGEPYCTRSQYIVYWSQNEEYVAGVHQYLRPDGTLGSSGRPDPNRLLIEGRVIAYSPRKSPPELL